jgi:hypothetical protein
LRDNVGFTALAVDGPNVYVSGHCSVTGYDPLFVNCTNSQNVMWFDGSYVRGLGTGLSSNAYAIAVMNTNVFFGGPFTNAGGATAKGIARWDGRNWSEVGEQVQAHPHFSGCAGVHPRRFYQSHSLGTSRDKHNHPIRLRRARHRLAPLLPRALAAVMARSPKR